MDEACSIFKWLEKNNPKLANVLDDNCASGFFRPGRNGVTFLLPTGSAEKDLMDEFKKDPLKATHHLKALIMDVALPTEEDWDAQKNSLPNRMRIKVKVKSVDKGKVTFANGATAVPSKKFKPRADRTNMSVWDYSGPLPPTEGERADYAAMAKTGGARKKRKRGGFHETQLSSFRRKLLDEAADLVSRGQYVAQNPFTKAVTSYLSWMDAHNKEYCNSNLCPLMDNAPEVTFLILFGDAFEPKGRTEWLAETGGICVHGDPSGSYIVMLDKAAGMSGNLRKLTRESRNRIRPNNDRFDLRARMVKEYKDLAENYSPVYASGPMLKAMHDETRFLVNQYLPDQIASRDVDGFKGTLSFALQTQRSTEKTIIVSESLTDIDKLSATAYYNGSLLFYNSDCYLYAPYVAKNIDSNEQLKELMGDESNNWEVNPIPINRPSTFAEIVNGDLIAESAGYERVKRGEKNPQGLEGMINAMKTVPASEVSGELREKFVEAMRKFTAK